MIFKLVPVAPLNRRLFANRFVLVVFVPVAFTQVTFWRVVRPVTTRFDMAPVPVTFRLVRPSVCPVALFQVTVFRFEVPVTVRVVKAKLSPVASRNTASIARIEPVTVRLETMRPPKSVTVVVAVAPRWVTDARVSVSMVFEVGQFVPSDRQIPLPMTVAVAKVPMFAMSWVVEATPVTRRLDPVAPLNRRLFANRFVEVVFVPVAFTQMMFVGKKFDP